MRYDKNNSVPDDNLYLDRPPRGIRMEREFDGTTVLRIRTLSSNVGFYIMFGLFWNAITSVFVCIAIGMTAARFGWNLPDYKLFKAGANDASSWWGLWLFLTPFIAVGIGMIYAVIFNIFGKCVIRIGQGKGSVYTGIGPFGKTWYFSQQSVKEIDTHWTNVQVGGSQIHKLAIEMNNGRKIKLPSLNDMSETWLAFALGKILKL